MQYINLKKEELNNLKRFFPKTMMFGTESKLYLYKKDDTLKIIKVINEMTDNKILTINLINNYSKNINIQELVLKSDIARIDNKPIGTITNYIEGTILSNIIYDKNTPLSYKIDLLKKIGCVLDKIKKVRNSGIDFYIGDLHDDNIIVTKNNDIRILDMDSSKIMNNEAFPSKYLTRFVRRKKYDNYIINPTESTDNYCFNMMILNALFSKDMSKLKIADFNRHIDFLDSLGIDKNLINNFYSMYNDNNVLNLYTELDSLKKQNKIYLK